MITKDDDPPLGIILCLICCLMFLATSEAKDGIIEIPKSEPSQIATIQGNSLMPISPLPMREQLVLSSLMIDIIACESGWDCEAKNPDSGAYGYCQFLDSTWEYVQRKWGLKLDINNPADQLYSCQRLYEEEGSVHWLASYNCWK